MTKSTSMRSLLPANITQVFEPSPSKQDRTLKPSTNRHSVSFGLIVKTNCGRIVLLERKVPYCIQNFYVYLHKFCKHETFNAINFLAVRDRFEKQHLSKLSKRDKLEYVKFLSGEKFEDYYDFPHGQYQKSSSKFTQDTKFKLFLSAYREFVEESGFRFTFTKEDVERYNMTKIVFKGLDGYEYIQYYFVVNDAKRLKRCTYFESFSTGESSSVKSWGDDKLVFSGRLVPVDEAFEKLRHQQFVKRDNKHLLCFSS